jgi:hypothetical protein
MSAHKGNPAAHGVAGRAPNGLICLVAMSVSENKASPRSLQYEFLRRRGISPQRADLLASFIFGEMGVRS